MRRLTRVTSGMPRLALLTLTISVPGAETPQPNCSSIGSVRELPGDMVRPGIGIGAEVGRGTGTKGPIVLDVEINVGTLRTPKPSRNSNPNPPIDSCWSVWKTSVKPAWNSGTGPQNGLARNTGTT